MKSTDSTIVMVSVAYILQPILPAHTANILVIPANINSHINYFSRLAVGLVGEGNTVVMVLPSTATPSTWLGDAGVKVMTYDVHERQGYMTSEDNSKAIARAALTTSALSRVELTKAMIEKMSASWIEDCEDMFADAEIVEGIQNGGFDFALMDTAGLECYLSLPYSMDLPFALVSLYSFAWSYRVPAVPSFVPCGMTGYTDLMTFKERFINIITESLAYMFAPDDVTMKYHRKYAPNKTPRGFFEIAREARLWFYLDDISVGFPKPYMPNTIPIGDIMARPTYPLPPELGAFISAAPRGVLLASFGSYVDHLPLEVIAKFCDVFKVIELKVIWKLLDPSLCRSEGQIFTSPWLPQNDILGSGAVKVFITHGGINSLIEAVNHGVPCLVVPLILDQPSNAAFVRSRGIGESIDISGFTSAELGEKIQRITNTESYRNSARNASRILNDKPETASRRASFYISHVIKYGSLHLRSRANELTPLQFFMFDIFFFIFLLAIVFCVILSLCVTCFWKLIRKFLFSSRASKMKGKSD